MPFRRHCAPRQTLSFSVDIAEIQEYDREAVLVGPRVLADECLVDVSSFLEGGSAGGEFP